MNFDIKQSLTERFAAPLPENYARRIIFWHDPDCEFAEQAEELCPDGVKLFKLTGTNNFEAKLLLSKTDTKSDYLVYNPLSYSDISDNWLLDIELYSESFRADLLSVRMQALDMPDKPELRRAMKEYSKFFENKERMAKLAALDTNYTSASQLHIDILAVLTGAAANTPAGVIRALLEAGLDADENAALINIGKFGSTDVLQRMLYTYTGYSYIAGEELLGLASHLLLSALSVTAGEELLKGLSNHYSAAHSRFCYAAVDEWMHSDGDDALYDIAREVETEHHLAYLFGNADVDELLSSECFPCINECILHKFMTGISNSVIRPDEIIAAVEKRRTLKWYKRVRYYYEGILQVAQMQQFISENRDGFHIGEHTGLWQEYCGNYCRMDYYYRQFHTAFGKSLKESSTVLEDLYKSVADYVENLYKNSYLAALGSQWTRLIADELSNGGALDGIPQQTEFYNSRVRPIINGGSRAYVIISDALRYEVAVELTRQLTSDTKGSAKISAMQSMFPSATKFGMAALLPHSQLQLGDGLNVLCDGLPSDGTANREKILQRAHSGNAAITYDDLISMKQAERRERVADAQAVYIYHNAIDAVGDKAITEKGVFEACEKAVTELKNLVRIITNDLSGSNIIITADHGFLYSYLPLDESDKAEKAFVSGRILELDRRYIIAESSCTAEHMLKIPLTHLGSSLSGFAPLENIRIKKQGGGMNYVHGGISLQECVVPVIEFKNMRATSKKFTDVKKAALKLISQSRKVTNSIIALDFYQTEAVSGKTAAANYEIFFADVKGNSVSDKKSVIADKTVENAEDRVTRVRFTLKSLEFKNTETYYLTVVDKDTGSITERTEFTIDIVFVNDFDF